MLKTWRFGVQALVVALLGAGATAALATGAPAKSTAVVTVKTMEVTSLGKILVSSTGRTLYHDLSEAKDSVRCTGACAAQWPPLTLATGARLTAGPGLTASLLGTVKRPNGQLQVTYHGMPLYLYAGDTKAGQANGQGVGDTWYAVAPSGSVVKTSVAPPKTSSGSSGTSTSSSSSTSYPASSSSSPASSTSTSSTTSSATSSSDTSTTTTTGGSSSLTDCSSNPGAYGCM